MTPTEGFLYAALGATWGGIGLSFGVGKWVRSRETDVKAMAEQFKSVTTALMYRIEQLEKRTEHAGGHMSDLATAVQGLPERLRQSFVTREEWDLTERRKTDPKG